MTLEEIRERLAAHREELRERFRVKSLAIFGSFVRDQETSESDVDILVELDQPCGWEIVDLRDYLEALLGVKVGLVTKGALLRKPALWRSIEIAIHDYFAVDVGIVWTIATQQLAELKAVIAQMLEDLG